MALKVENKPFATTVVRLKNLLYGPLREIGVDIYPGLSGLCTGVFVPVSHFDRSRNHLRFLSGCCPNLGGVKGWYHQMSDTSM